MSSRSISCIRGVALAAALALGAAASAPAVDWSLAGGVATSNQVKKAGVIAGWTQPNPLWQGQQWRIALRHEVELAFWRVPQARNLIEIGYSPVFRLEHPLARKDSAFFVEASIGVRLLSRTRLAVDKTMSTAFQFSDVLGVGWQWDRSTLGVRFQHLSNAGIKRPNPGINFTQIYYTYRF